MENTFDTIVILDAQGTVQYESPSIQRTVGYDARERVQRHAAELVHPDDVARMTGVFNELLSGRAKTVQSEVRARPKDGSWRTMQSTTTNLLDDPNARGIVIVSRDVTEQRITEEANARLLASERAARGWAETTLEQLHAEVLGQLGDADRLPQVVIMDVSLPNFAGLATLGYIPRDTHLRRLPVIVLTSFADPPEHRQFLECGASAVITKPFSSQGLLNLATQFARSG
jgi:PAS domain S-box-containing protein